MLDRYDFPWINWSGRTAQDSASTGPVREEAPGRFGTLLFRRRRSLGTDVKIDLLAVLICAETPTAGIDRVALLRALRAVESLRLVFWDGFDHGIHLLAPTFSGSQTSLEDVLLTYAIQRKFAVLYRVVSGTSLGIDRKQFEGRVPIAHFASTQHSAKSSLLAILKYLKDRTISLPLAHRQPIVLLTESNTGFGQSIQKWEELKPKGNQAGNKKQDKSDYGEIVFYQFPMHIASIRASYERLGLLNDAASRAIRGAARLSVPSDESGGARDLPPPMTPGITAGNDEMALIEALADIGRLDPSAVGIMATDPRDVVFLARKVRELCPDAQLFTNQAELLYARPQVTATLRGMLIATTYPLAMRNKWWVSPIESNEMRQSFSSDSATGVYNAMIAHLVELSSLAK